MPRARTGARPVRGRADRAVPDASGRGRGPAARIRVLRENFIERVFAYRAAARAVRRPLDHAGALVAFHTAHKMALLAHSTTAYQELGRLVAAGKALARTRAARTLRALLHGDAGAYRLPPRRHTNVLHAHGRSLEEACSTMARSRSWWNRIDEYRRGLVPLIVPLTLLRHYVRAPRHRLPRRPDLPGAASARADAAQPCLSRSRRRPRARRASSRSRAWPPAVSRRTRDVAAAEEPLDVRLHGRSFAVIMRTPGEERALAAGFLLSERIIRSAADIGAIEHCRHPDQSQGAPRRRRLSRRRRRGARAGAARERRQVIANSSCGVCGRATIDELAADIAPLRRAAVRRRGR